MTAKRRNRKPLFPLGQVYMTPGAQRALAEQIPTPPTIELLDRHRNGDWGCIDREDAASNRAAIRYGNRILSAYPIDPEKPCAGYGDNCLWIITEADRSVTTILLPSEY